MTQPPGWDGTSLEGRFENPDLGHELQLRHQDEAANASLGLQNQPDMSRDNSQQTNNNRHASTASSDNVAPETNLELENGLRRTPTQDQRGGVHWRDGFQEDERDAHSQGIWRHGAAADDGHADPLPYAAPTRERAGVARRRSTASRVSYDVPDNFANLDEVATPSPVQNPHTGSIHRRESLETGREHSNMSRRRSTASRLSYDLPDVFSNLDEVAVPGPVQNPREGSLYRRESLELGRQRSRRRSTASRVSYDCPDEYANLDEVAVASPVQNPNEDAVYRHESLEAVRSREQDYLRDQRRRQSISGEPGRTPSAVEQDAEKSESEVRTVTRIATQIYTLSYLVFFAIFGTLARLGLQALMNYPGAPVIFLSVWPNFAGSLIMGFLAEDRMLFRDEWESAMLENHTSSDEQSPEGSRGSDRVPAIDLEAAKRTHIATKKTIPLYIGLATGFCGSFTSFSAFIRDAFLAISNDLPSGSPSTARNGGYSFMALLGVILTTVSLSLGGLFLGAHLAIALEPLTQSIPNLFTRRVLDRLAVFLGWGCWIGAIVLCALPPDRDSAIETWRGGATIALALAPLGCLARFYASLYLNGRRAAFPLGTFTVNVAGTAVLGAAWDLAHVGSGGVVGCQVLQGVEDGFCGCLTTVSTWVAELSGLGRRNSYIYGATSVLVSLATLVATMGGLRWSDGFGGLACTH